MWNEGKTKTRKVKNDINHKKDGRKETEEIKIRAYKKHK
jgi:hypothetical protein